MHLLLSGKNITFENLRILVTLTPRMRLLHAEKYAQCQGFDLPGFVKLLQKNHDYMTLLYCLGIRCLLVTVQMLLADCQSYIGSAAVARL